MHGATYLGLRLPGRSQCDGQALWRTSVDCILKIAAQLFDMYKHF
jgi:hypothetical protein